MGHCQFPFTSNFRIPVPMPHVYTSGCGCYVDSKLPCRPCTHAHINFLCACIHAGGSQRTGIRLMSCCVLVFICTDINMDCCKTQFVTGCGTQASASRIFISSGDKVGLSGQLECPAHAESASIEEPDLANIEDSCKLIYFVL